MPEPFANALRHLGLAGLYEMPRNPHAQMRADVFCPAVWKPDETVKETRRDAYNFGHCAHAVPHSKLSCAPCGELIAVAATSCNDVRDHAKKLEPVILRPVADP